MSTDLQRPWIFGTVAQLGLIVAGTASVARGINLQHAGQSDLWAFAVGGLLILMAAVQRFLMPLMARTRPGAFDSDRSLHLRADQSRVMAWTREIFEGLEVPPISTERDPASMTAIITSRYLGLSTLRSVATVTLTRDGAGTLAEITSRYVPPALADSWINKKNIDEIAEALQEREASDTAVHEPPG